MKQWRWLRRGLALCGASLLLVGFAAHAAAAKNPPAHKIDINLASAKEFQELPGVGPKTAEAIIQFRTKSGPFRRVEDLLAIRGISETKLAKMRAYVVVGALPPKKPSTHASPTSSAPKPSS